jgi:N4-(beta-N-acetylglucosaminyl)-L-asparaginase
MKFSRRHFITAAAATSASLASGLTAEAQEAETRAQNHKREKTEQMATGKRPAIICKVTGTQGIDGGYEILRRGGDTLDAALHVCKVQEDDPNDDSVGYGGLPNEEGEVELDACCMHGPTRRAGSVAGVRNIKNVSLLAKAVMNRTGHLMLVAEGAQRFAVAHGFPKENLLTDRSRKIWLLWKESMSNQDWWGPGIADPAWRSPLPRGSSSDRWKQRIESMYELAEKLGIEPDFRREAIRRVLNPPTGTIHVSVVNEKGEMSGATTTSGLAWKLPGRIGDSPILGAGCWCDQDVGSAGATGSGEENIKVAGAHTIVENMRKGMSPQEAGLDALRRIVRNHNNNMEKLRFLDMVYYILRKDGAYAGVSLWSHGSGGGIHRFAIHDGEKRVENCVPLLQGRPTEWPPIPELAPAAAK